MSVAKIVEIIAGSKTSFEHAVETGIARATDTLHDVTSAWIKDQSVIVANGKVTEYRVTMKITFIMKDAQKKSRKKK